MKAAVLIGAHVPSIAPIEEAAERGADLVQVFLSNPQSWKKPAPRADAAALRENPEIRVVLSTGQSDTEAAGRAIESSSER